MIIFRGIDIKNYRNIKHAELKDLQDLNIVIGPNNCGKTTILKFIQSLGKLGLGYEYLCPECEDFRKSDSDIRCLFMELGYEDFYLKKLETQMIVEFSLDEEQIKQLVPVPRVLEKQKEKLKNASCGQISDSIVMEKTRDDHGLKAKHFSIFIHSDIIEEIKRNILYCPEQRLQNYKGKKFEDYIREMNLKGAQRGKWKDFLKKIDAKIDDETYEKLIRKIDGEDFETPLSEQGSGVRSLACLAVDILFRDAKIVLIDEPELGLNPFVKQEFLNFLLDESKERQIVIATQDPTFVNPILWKGRKEKVSVYFYTPIEEKFIKIDLKQNQGDPNTFAGYLPHTTSLKDIHLYVEGTSDAYIFQILLEKHLKEKYENWFEITNKVGIYHLNGDNWKHMLYTIPKTPYRCAVILDGDKRKTAEKVCGEYNTFTINASKFKFCEKIEDVKNTFGKESHPVYCLKEDCIEKYFIPDFGCANSPRDYKKKRDGPKKAEELKELPPEIKVIFEVILESVKDG